MLTFAPPNNFWQHLVFMHDLSVLQDKHNIFPERTVAESGKRDCHICKICDYMSYVLAQYDIVKMYHEIGNRYFTCDSRSIFKLFTVIIVALQFLMCIHGEQFLFEVTCLQPQKISQPHPWVRSLVRKQQLKREEKIQLKKKGL